MKPDDSAALGFGGRSFEPMRPCLGYVAGLRLTGAVIGRREGIAMSPKRSDVMRRSRVISPSRPQRSGSLYPGDVWHRVSLAKPLSFWSLKLSVIKVEAAAAAATGSPASLCGGISTGAARRPRWSELSCDGSLSVFPCEGQPRTFSRLTIITRHDGSVVRHVPSYE